MSANGPLRVGIGGPVGSGKTTLTEKLCKAMREHWSIAVIASLEAVILRTAARASASTLDDLGSGAIVSDIAAMRHETLEGRLFIS